MIEYAAPGKAVIWGEYAVLAGAPALVMAVNRYARAAVTLEGDRWQIRSTGFESEMSVSARALDAMNPANADGAAAVVRSALAALGNPPLPPGARITTDTTAFHERGDKLGIGSSAAICTAVCAALADAFSLPFERSVAQAAHQFLQGRAGSGLDIAAACEGGLLRFQSGAASPFLWPENLHYRFFWVGHSAKTTDHLAKFGAWRAAGTTGPLDELGKACEALFAHPGLGSFRDYVRQLKSLDRVAKLGIYDAAHARLDELASHAQVVYKPCGAGGGDIGIAVGDDAARLESLHTLAVQESFLPLNLEIAAHGVHRISS
ncbi:MAG TPA: hypothetical protein VIS76_06870 [Pseudomonadales bacterium]